MSGAREHWEQVWSTRHRGDVSWFQEQPTVSLELIGACGLSPDDPIVDVGGGASVLASHLLGRGYRNLTVVDIAAAALAELDASLVEERGQDHGVRFVCADVRAWEPDRAYALWHDRAVSHFLTEPDDRHHYATLAARTVAPGGHLVLATFAPDGPDQCSGLPVRRSSPDALAAELEGFDLVQVVGEQHVTPWQVAQAFQYLLLRRRA